MKRKEVPKDDETTVVSEGPLTCGTSLSGSRQDVGGPAKPPPKRKKPSTPQKAKKEADRPTEPMNISGQMTNIEHLLPHIEAMNIPHDMAVETIKRIFPHGAPTEAMPAINSLFDTINVIGPTPSSINTMFTMAMGGFNANNTSSAEHALNLTIIAQLSAAMRNKTPHVQTNRLLYETSQEDLQKLVERHICPKLGRFDADAILTNLENDIARRQNPYDESRNLGLFCQSASVPTVDVALPAFYIGDILDNLHPTENENDPTACSWGGYCMVVTHGSPLTFRIRNTRKRPLRCWKARGEEPWNGKANPSGSQPEGGVDNPAQSSEWRMCIVCEIVHFYALILEYKRIGRSPPCILQRFSVICDPEIGLPENALIFPEAPFNGLIAPFINADWFLAHLVAPSDDKPYTLLRGYFQKR